MPVHLDHIGPAARGGARSKGSLQKLGRWKISARRILVEKEAGREVDAQSHCHGRQQRIKLCRILCTADFLAAAAAGGEEDRDAGGNEDYPRDPEPEIRKTATGDCFTYVVYFLNETVSGSGSLS